MQSTRFSVGKITKNGCYFTLINVKVLINDHKTGKLLIDSNYVPNKALFMILLTQRGKAHATTQGIRPKVLYLVGQTVEPTQQIRPTLLSLTVVTPTDATIGMCLTTTGIVTPQPIALLNTTLLDTMAIPALIKFYHRAAVYPTKPTWIKAIDKGNYSTWHGLTSARVWMHLQVSEHTMYGHMHKLKQGIKSTLKQLPVEQTPELPQPELIDAPDPPDGPLTKHHTRGICMLFPVTNSRNVSRTASWSTQQDNSSSRQPAATSVSL